jgi:3'(2'), 5'-bisphosphate nucleotidase
MRRVRAPIHCRPLGASVAAIASKSHLTQATDDYLAEAVGMCDHVRSVQPSNSASSPKGKADIYPRLSPTSEWDTAAGPCRAARGWRPRSTGSTGAAAYGKKAFLNRGFCATGRLGRRLRSVHIWSHSAAVAASFRRDFDGVNARRQLARNV